MPTEYRIYLESKPVTGSFGNAGHMYLVLREVEVNGNYVSNIRRDNDQVIRGGGPSPSNLTPSLVIEMGRLADSEDKYLLSDSPSSRHSTDITQKILAGGNYSNALSAWDALTSTAEKITGQYGYEIPAPFDSHVANSNAVIFSVLAKYGVDARTIIDEFGATFVESYYAAGHPGADFNSATVIATDKTDIISAGGIAGQSSFRDILVEGRSGRSDIFLNTSLNEKFFGEQDFSGLSRGYDRVLYGSPAGGLSLQASGASDSINGQNNLRLSSDTMGTDDFFGIESVELSAGNDVFQASAQIPSLSGSIVVDGGGQSGDQGDILDFSGRTSAVLLGSASSGFFNFLPAPHVVEIYSGWSQPSDILRIVSNDLPLTGLTQASGLRLTSFEKVIGTSANDVLDLTWLNPGGELTAAQEQALTDARSIRVALGNPATVAQAEQARLEVARQIPQNQVDVTISGGSGNDLIIGPRTGAATIYGGEGVDVIRAGGFASTIYGEAGTDYVYGGGFGSELYGGEGADVFGLADHAFVKDAETKDYAVWGSFVLTGGVQQSWMEDGWAYYAPFSSLVAFGAPLGFADLFGALAIMLDVPALTTVRYGVTQSNQLVVQFANGRAGQAVIDNYRLDTDTGEATAHIVAFRQVRAHATLDQYKNYLNLALLAGFGGEPAGTDPLVLDLDGDGLELTRPDSRDVYFDVDQDGFAERTAWVGGDDGLLARDLNDNGKIDDISELFGNASTTGFSSLSGLDSNQDGKISAADAGFSTLKVWRDINGNGVTDSGELQSLSEAGISEISLGVSTPAQGSIRGNTITAQSTFKRTDGTTSTIADVILQNNQIDSRYLGDTAVSPSAAALMNLKGFGTLTDLSVAMSHDASLLTKVTSLKDRPAATSWATLQADARDILFRWAGVDGSAALPMGGGTFDTQRLAFLERYMGQQLAPRATNGQPTDANVAELITTWNDVLNRVTIRLTVEGPLHAVFNDIAYDLATDRFMDPGTSALADAYRNVIAILPSDPAAALDAWNSNWSKVLTAYASALVRNGGQEILPDYIMQSLVHALDGTTTPLTLDQLAAGLGISGLHIGTGSSDTINRGGAAGLQIYVAGAGNDTITGGFGQDVYVFGRNFGQDDIFDDDALSMGDRIRFADYAPSDLSFSREGDDLVIRVKSASDRIIVHGQYAAPTVTLAGQVLTPDHAIEEIQFADGTIYETGDIAAAIGLGTDNDDVIDGTPFGDQIEGLRGNDLLRGGNSGDSYFYSPGDGNDTIQDVVTNPALVGHDTLFLLGGIKAEDVHLTRNADSNDVTMSFGRTGDSILLKDQFAYSALGYGTQLALDWRVEDFMFYGGAGWTWRDLQAKTLATYTTDGDDATYGFGTGDQFQISGGDDLLVGFDGGDTYRFGRGAGHDVIHDQQHYPETFISNLIGYGWGEDDVLEFAADVQPSDITFSRPGAAPDLLISIAGSPDTLLIKNQFVGSVLDIFGLLGMAWFNRVETFKFADGTTLTWEDVLRTVTTGAAGNDSLYGAYYPDVLTGKTGDDYLSGGDDGDTYIINRGDGHDVVEDLQNSILNDNPDSVQFGPGITASDLSFTRQGSSNDLLITIANSTDTVLLKGQFIYSYNIFDMQPDRIEFLKFSDGTSIGWEQIIQNLDSAAGTAGDDAIYGFSYQDLLDGKAGNDFISGRSESDTYIFGRGYAHDTIRDNMDSILATDTDVVRFKDASLSEVTFSRSGNSDDLQLSINGTNDVLTVEGQFNILYGLFNFIPDRIERFEFLGNTVLSWEDVIQRFDSSAGTVGNDTIYGFSYADTLAGGLGDDTLDGGRDNDTYVYNRGDGHDIIIEGADAQVTAFDTLRLHGIDQNDVQLLRNDNDVTLVIAETSVGAGNAGSIRLKEELNDFFNRGVEQIVFDDGTIWSQNDLRLKLSFLAATPGNDTIVGFNTNDILRGLAGNDTLSGGVGDDTYIYARGDGNDIIIEGTGGNNSTIDTLSLLGIAPSSVSLVRNANDATLVIAPSSSGANDGGSILLKDELNDFFSQGVERIVFEDGTVWTQNDLRLKALSQATTSGNDVINGFNTNDTLVGGAGNDTLIGGAGDDTYVYSRGDGQDLIIEGTGGNFSTIDTLVIHGITPAQVSLIRDGIDLKLNFAETAPGAGNGGSVVLKSELVDYFSQGVERVVFDDGTIWTQAYLIANAPSASIFSFSRGSGAVNASPSTTLVQMGPGIVTSDLMLQSNSYGDLSILIRDTNDSIRIANDLTKRDWGVSSAVTGIRLDDGTFIFLGKPAADQGEPLTFTYLGTANNYNLTGSNFGSNVYEITSGNGSINFGNASGGGNGLNTIKFTRGAGIADVQLNNGTGAISFGVGVASSDVYLQANSYGDLTVKIRNDATDAIVIHNDLSNVAGAVRSAVDSIRFVDGSQISLTAPLTFTWLGSANNYNLFGSNYGSNVYEITSGNGSINFSSSASSSNSIKFTKNAGAADVQTNGGSGIISFSAGVAVQDVYLQANSYGDLIVKIRNDATDNILVHNALSAQAGSVSSKIGQLQFASGSTVSLSQPLTFTWLGNANNYNLYGSNFGSNVFEITAGNGSVNFGNTSNGGTNLVKFSRGTGHLDVTLNGGTGVIEMGAGISSSELIVKSNSYGDLIINIAGDATDGIVVHNDFGAANGIQTSAVSAIRFNDGSSVSPLSYDFLAPSISSIVASGSGISSGNGTLGIGSVVTLTVNFNEAVSVNTSGGMPTLTLNNGGSATYAGGSGSGALTFAYTVASGQNTSDLAVSAFNLNGSTVADLAGNAAVLSGASANPTGTLIIDGTAPSVNSVSTSPASGTLILGNTVVFTVNFNESVTVNTAGGTPVLTLNDGGSATYTGGSGTTALTFAHTVANGQSTADLAVISLSLNGGTIADAAGNAAIITGAAVNPTGTLAVDGVVPAVTSVTSSGTGITAGAGVLNAGKLVTLTVAFGEAVTVVTAGGTPTLTLNSGGVATYASGSGSNALVFNYTVANGQNTSDLAITALNLNGGTIKDSSGNSANIAGAISNPAGVLQIDTTLPTVASVTTSGSGITSGSGFLGVGKVVAIAVNFNENVAVNTTGGTPTLTLNNGGVATYTTGTGTGSLNFSYTVAAGQSTADLAVTALNLNGGTIKDAAGNAAIVTGAVVNPAGTLSIDGSVPTVTSVTTSPSSGTVIQGGVVTLTVNFSESVAVNVAGGTPTLALNDGGTATYSGGSGTGALTFIHTVAAGQSAADLSVTALNLNGGTISDVGGNNAILTGAAVNPTGTLLIDGNAPTITSIATSGTGITSGNGTLGAGKVVTLTATFSENVTVVTTGGTPTLSLNDGGTATYASGSGTTALVFNHTVAAGQNALDLAVTALNLNGGTIKDANGNVVVLASAALNPAGTLKIDTVGSIITGVSTSGAGITAGTGALNAGKVVSFTVTFDENVTVGSKPILTLNDGGTATYASGSGTASLVFNHTIAAGQNAADLAVTALSLNGGTIKDAAGNNAVLTGAAVNPTGTLLVDTVVPTVSSVATSGVGITAGAGSLNAGKTVTFSVNFNEAVIVTTTSGTPTLTLNDGGVATYNGGSGTNALTFGYTVAAGRNTADLAVTAFNLNTGTIKDAAGNAAVVTGAVTNPAGVLKIDTTASTVGSVVTSGAGITSGSGTVGAGSVVTLTVNFSEAVLVTTAGGVPTLGLNTGGMATYTGGSGGSALSFSYTVAAGENTSDLTVTAFNLNGGLVNDAAGNPAVVTGAVVNPSGTLKVTTTAARMASMSMQPTEPIETNSIATLSATDLKMVTSNYALSSPINETVNQIMAKPDNYFQDIEQGRSNQIIIPEGFTSLRDADHAISMEGLSGSHHPSIEHGFLDKFYPQNRAELPISVEGLRIDNQISQLVQAMANHSGNRSIFDSSSISTIPAESTVQNFVAASWHSQQY